MGNVPQPAIAPAIMRTLEGKKQSFIDHWSPSYPPNKIYDEGKRIITLSSKYSHILKLMNPRMEIRASWMYKDVQKPWVIEANVCICDGFDCIRTHGYRSVSALNGLKIITWLLICEKCNNMLLYDDAKCQVEEKEANIMKRISQLETIIGELIADKDKRELSTMVLTRSEPISLSID